MLLADVLKILPTIKEENLPRMAEYARFGIALEKALKLPSGKFMDILDTHNDTKMDRAFHSDQMCMFIDFVIGEEGSCFHTHGDSFIGTSKELLSLVETFCKRTGVSKASMPQTPKSLKGRLTRIKPLLESKGIDYVELPRTSDKRSFYLAWKDRKKSPLFESDLEAYLNPEKWIKYQMTKDPFSPSFSSSTSPSSSQEFSQMLAEDLL